jgi:tetratricopeptide (TPR) repeat protein
MRGWSRVAAFANAFGQEADRGPMDDTMDSTAQVLALYRGGDLAGARAEAEKALAADSANAALLQLLGIICCRSGDLDSGAAHLRTSLSLQPGDSATRLGLANALVALGAFEEADKVCRSDFPDPALWRLHGFVLQTLDRHDEAAESYVRVLESQPGDWEIWNNLGNSRRAAGDHRNAIAALEKALALRPDVPAIQYNLGTSLAAGGRLAEGIAALAQALRLSPDLPGAMFELGRALRHAGRFEEALPALERAAGLTSDKAEIRLELGRALAGLHRFEEAERAYEQALAVQPGLADAFLELGLMLERGNKLDRLPALLAEAEAQGVPSKALSYLHALALDGAGRTKEALAAAQAAPVGNEPVRRAALIGRLADKAGDTATAFAAFAEMNRLVGEDRPGARAEAAAYLGRVRALTGMLTDAYAVGWPTQAPGGRPAPIFLVGFPRSGTTLLDTMLMGHPALHVLEEEPILQRVGDALGDFERLPGLDDIEAKRLRALYFEELDRFDPAAKTKVVVDKLPLNILGAPLIHRLFPDSKLIFASRHPCDVVLSCLMQNFDLNDAMASFLDLGDSARLYDQVLTFWQRCRDLFPLAVHVVRYEALVEDVEAELRPLIDFLDLPWDDALLDHQATAAKRGAISTPSYAQVAERIYTRARGRWERYRPQMEEVLPILLPWAERLGYET